MKVKDASKAAERFKTRGAAAARDYEEGVKTAGADWQRQTLASEENFEAGVNAAIARKSFGKGVAASGGDFYAERAGGVGAARFGPGIQAAAPIWQEGVTPFLDTLRNLDPGPKGPKGDPRNWQRSQKVGEALRAKKLSMR